MSTTRLGWSLLTKSAIGGCANLQAVIHVKLEQASKHTMWMPTGRLYREEPGARARR